MIQEDKELLLQDLCVRLPYGVKGIITYNGDKDIFTVKGIFNILFLSDTECCHIEDFKPYLRPLSSMTDEEKEELKNLFDAEEVTSDSICYFEGGTLEEYLSHISYSFCSEIIDYLNAHHFDYRGLIERGLAIEAPEGMYKKGE